MNRLVLLTAALVALGACRHDPKPTAGGVPDGQPLAHVLRTYKIPPGHDKAVERLLKGNSYPIQVVSEGGAQTQFVRLNPQFTRSGFFVLSAPETIHRGVEDILAQIASSKPADGAPSIDVTYWVVLAWPTSDAEAQISPELAALTSPLGKLKELGSRRFELLERLQVVALDGEEGTTAGQFGHVKHTASAVADAVELRMELQVMGGQKNAAIETAVSVAEGQFAVLGQVGYMPVKYDGSTGMPTLLFITRATAVN